MIFKTLRSSIIFILLIGYALLVIPLILVTRGITNRALGLGINPDVEETLQGATRLAQVRYQEKKRFLTRSVSAQLSYGEELLNSDLNELEPRELIWAITDSNYTIIKAEKDFPANFLTSVSKSYQRDEKTLVYRQPLSDRYVVWGCNKLDDEFVKQFESSIAAVQNYDRLKRQKVELESSLNRLFLLTAFIMIIFGTFIGVIFSRGITKPLVKLIEGTSKIAKGDFSTRIKVMPRGEIGLLIGAFNSMAEQLENYEIEKQRVQEEKLKEQKIVMWQQIAKQMAHEIMNPLTPISLSIQHLKDIYTEKPEIFKDVLNNCTQKILEEISHLKKLVMSFQKFAKLPEPNMSMISLKELVIDFIRFQHNERIRFAFECLVENPLIEADKQLIEQILLNLTQNSIQAEESNRIINLKIKIEKEKNKIILQFMDDGPGVKEEDLEKLTDIYFTTKESGRGLGLTIVDRILDQHKAIINFRNNHPRGLIVIMTFPEV
ncbi:MAG: HAMP domain-containing protein [Candidatus Coatesbacteria bacterium]|nr:HAMP domain-containing protein [Candidatus Coatesbacteria bacterium]